MRIFKVHSPKRCRPWYYLSDWCGKAQFHKSIWCCTPFLWSHTVGCQESNQWLFLSPSWCYRPDWSFRGLDGLALRNLKLTSAIILTWESYFSYQFSVHFKTPKNHLHGYLSCSLSCPLPQTNPYWVISWTSGWILLTYHS